ncbi:transglutaminase family protein [Novosphingobium lentum]|uniref:transglutaminase family protein n=1 Tax=Novosphingobium lentum TaxID=145287 RepID=UPI000831713A|nr:transglutaminase family protein [Novosphingobium lentum]
MIYHVRHLSTLTYDSAVDEARFNIRLKPIESPRQRLLNYRLSVTPLPHRRRERFGPYPVNTTRLEIDAPLGELSVLSEFSVEVFTPPPLGATSPTIAHVRRAAVDLADLGMFAPAAYLFSSRLATIEREIGVWAAPYLDPGAAIVPSILALSSALHAQFAYRPGATDTDTPPIEAFRARHGVCQDFAHILIVGLRAHGIPAAYLAGYIRTVPPPGMPRLIGADAMHAWVNVWCGPDLGWIAIDPTNDRVADEDYVVVAMGRDYADVSPVDGVYLGSPRQTTRVEVDMMPQDL